jgi:hypothetical protein
MASHGFIGSSTGLKTARAARRAAPRAACGSGCTVPGAGIFSGPPTQPWATHARSTSLPEPSLVLACKYTSTMCATKYQCQWANGSGRNLRPAGLPGGRGIQGLQGCNGPSHVGNLACATGGPGPGKGTHRGSRPQWPATQPGKACSKVSSGCGVTLLPSGWRGVGMGRGRPPIRYSQGVVRNLFPPSSLSVLWGNLTRHST